MEQSVEKVMEIESMEVFRHVSTGLCRRVRRPFTGHSSPTLNFDLSSGRLRRVTFGSHLPRGHLPFSHVDMHLIGIHFMGMHLIGVRLIAMCLMGVHLMGYT